MAYSVAYQHTDGNRDNYGSYKLHGVKERKWDCQNLVVSFYDCIFAVRILKTDKYDFYFRSERTAF